MLNNIRIISDSDSNSEICGFHSRFHTCSICAPPDTRHVNSVCAFACPLPLLLEQVVA